MPTMLLNLSVLPFLLLMLIIGCCNEKSNNTSNVQLKSGIKIVEKKSEWRPNVGDLVRIKGTTGRRLYTVVNAEWLLSSPYSHVTVYTISFVDCDDYILRKRVYREELEQVNKAERQD